MNRIEKITGPTDECDLETAVEFIIANVPHPQLVEMYYWIQEHDLLRIVRSLAGTSKATREALAAFLDDVRPAQIDVADDSDSGEFTLRKDCKARLALAH
jgi:hypothetical protein